MKNSIVAALAFALLSGTASLAVAADAYKGGASTKDLPAPSFEKATVNWSGLYIGGAVGYGNANHDLSLHDYFKDYCGDSSETEEHGFGDYDRSNRADFLVGDKLTCNTPSGEGSSWNDMVVKGDSREIASIDGINSHGIVGDVRLGADIQRNRFVFGVYGAYGFNGMETNASITGLGTASIEKGDEWSLGARAGILVNPKTLAYILAAYTQADYDYRISGGGVTDSRNVTFDGVTVGGGIEFALTDQVFFGIEGTHTFFGEETVFDAYDPITNTGLRLDDEIGETKVMGTLKIKLNSDIGTGKSWFTD